MKTIVSIVLFSCLTLGLGGCASVSTVMQSDAPFSEKMKQLGAIVGEFFEGPTGPRADAVKKYGYAGAGDLLEVEGATVSPDTASPGQTVEATAKYVVLSPAATQPVSVTESRTLLSTTDSILLSRRDVVREQGSHASTLKFTLPADILKGNYTLVTSISNGTQSKSARTALRII